MYPGQGHGPGGHGHYPPQGGYGGTGGYGPPPGQWGQPAPGQWAPPPQQGYGGYQAPPQQQYHHQQQQHYPPQQHYNQQQYQQPPQHHYQQPYGQPDSRNAVPQGIQRFGHGAPNEYTFQYSNCTGKRKALLIGINYFGTKAELKGCINDVRNVSNFLMERYNYRREDMVILTDDQRGPLMQPTKDNITRAMQWLVKDAQPNDSLFLHYSGTDHDTSLRHF